MAVEVLSSTCIRYMPQFCVRAPGSLVKTSGRVKKRPPSCGQQWSTGSAREVGSGSITCWQGGRVRRRRRRWGKQGGEARETRGEADEVSEGGVVAEIEIAGHVAADFVEAFGAQRERHARVGAHRVDEQGEIGALDPLEEKGRGRPAS